MKVTAVVITFNHEKYIAQALDSVLMQETDFPCEIIVTEDCSTDATREIVREYGRRNPERMRLLLSSRNLNSSEVLSRAFAAARGEFIAVLDGDDYWTHPYKLQRQVEFLEAHPECSMCYHNMLKVFDDGSPPEPFNPPEQPRFSSTADTLRGCFAQLGSTLFRAAVLRDMPAWYRAAKWWDWPLLIHASHFGQLAFLDELWGVYRVHDTGFWSGMSEVEQLEGIARFYRLLKPALAECYRDAVASHLTLCYLELGAVHARAGRQYLSRWYALRALAEDPRGRHVDRAEVLQRLLGSARVETEAVKRP